eukprot:Plantae.Rhodophyta-Rhodochaete_pulchella.ctg3869.p2 GENE.Plantae.Rhodophyta-Rhodochaete_pulchella.ctg3869~~Plantae.Rhodophyta-Rhodochaete_pulchella.ctg3869.p2  ORF type:complete len:276 (+),score=32.11 Plantae.Rhodophyta-Rhodochaete_pulchella.ctg3869:214-1041(+)
MTPNGTARVSLDGMDPNGSSAILNTGAANQAHALASTAETIPEPRLSSRVPRQHVPDSKHTAFALWATISLGAVIGVVFWPYAADNVKYLRKAGKRTLYWYLRILHAHPFSARAISAGLIFFSADVVAQKLYGKTFSYARLCRYSVYGLAVMGPFLYMWYFVMHLYGPNDSLVGSIQKAIFEQVTLEPACISMYIIFDGVVRRRGAAAIRNKLRSDFWSLLAKNAVFWIPSNFANYYLGTQDLRVVFANVCSFFWNVYFSSRVNTVLIPHKKPEQ